MEMDQKRFNKSPGDWITGPETGRAEKGRDGEADQATRPLLAQGSFPSFCVAERDVQIPS